MRTSLLSACLSISLLSVPALALDPSKPDVPTEESLNQPRYVLSNPDGSFTMAGSMGDVERAKRLRKDYGDRFLWVRHQGGSYLITDAGLIDRAHKAVEPARKLGEQQAALGEQQAALGEKQAKIGEKMAAIGEKISRVAGRDDRSALREYEQQMRALEQEMRQYEEPQRELGKKQQKLGKQHEAVAQQMNREIVKIAEDAVASGKVVKL